MNIAFGILAGLLWGALFAYLNSLITKKAMKTANNNAVLKASILRNFIDVAALAAILLLRKIMPFSYTAMLIATAVSLSLLTIVFSYRIARTK